MLRQSCLTAFAAFAAASFFWPGQANAQARPATEWFYADGIIQPDGIDPNKTMKGVWSPTREWIVLFNLSSKDTTVTANFYFEDIPPRPTTKTVRARSSVNFAVQNIPNVVPPNKLYGARFQSPEPFLVQPTRGEYEPYNPVTHAMASFVAYPGPLGQKETKWAYADGLVISSDRVLEEWEWITVLNPAADRDAHVKITFNWPGEQKVHTFTVPAERVKTVDLFNLPIIPKNKIFGPIIESDVPVIVQQVRRCYARGIPVITSMWACLAYPIGDLKIE